MTAVKSLCYFQQCTLAFVVSGYCVTRACIPLMIAGVSAVLTFPPSNMTLSVGDAQASNAAMCLFKLIFACLSSYSQQFEPFGIKLFLFTIVEYWFNSSLIDRSHRQDFCKVLS